MRIRRGLGLAIGFNIALALNGCGGDIDPRESTSASRGVLSGELVMSIADFTNRQEVIYSLRESSGQEHTLAFETEPKLAPGTKIRVWGAEGDEAFRVNRFEVDPASPDGVKMQRSALVGAPMKTPRQWAFVLVDMGGGVNLTKEEATK